MQINLFTTTSKMIEGIKAYKITELEKKENLNYRTIKKRSSDYIPIVFENALSRLKSKR